MRGGDDKFYIKRQAYKNPEIKKYFHYIFADANLTKLIKHKLFKTTLR